jgi:hypothetical protein
VSLWAFVLRGISVLNVTTASALIVLPMLRSITEERFLRVDTSYAACLQEVRWRWFPGIAQDTRSAQLVTYVAGTFCNPCLRVGPPL